MQQAAQSSRTALTPQQVSYLQNKKSNLEKELAQTLQTIDVNEDNLESELSNMIKKQKMDSDEVQYVGLIKDSISYKEDLKTIQEWISKGLKESDYDHTIIKAFGFTKPKLNPPQPGPILKTVRDLQRENYIVQLQQMINYRYKSELLELYDIGMTDLNANLQAIDQAKGSIDQACNFLLYGKQQQSIFERYMNMAQTVKNPQMRKNLEILCNLNLTNFEENLDALTNSKGNVEVARKILIEKDCPIQIIPNQKSFQQPQSIAPSQMNVQKQSQYSIQPQKLSQSFQEKIQMRPAPAASNLDKLQQKLRDQLHAERQDSIEDVIEIISSMFEQEKDQSTQKNAREYIPICQDILSTQIEILKLKTQQLALELKLNKDITLNGIN